MKHMDDILYVKNRKLKISENRKNRNIKNWKMEKKKNRKLKN
jgi:hypothetical protein